MAKAKTPYNIMTSILKETNPTKEELQNINTFFFARWLSNNRYTMPISSVLNTYYNIPPEVQYRFANDYVELTNMRKKVKFIGLQKEKVHPDMQKLLDNIKRRYKVNEVQAVEYFNLMDENERNKMYSLYDTGLQK